MEEQLISLEVAQLAKAEGFTMFKDKFLESRTDNRYYDVQSYSFYRVMGDETTLELNVGTNSLNINGLWESYYDEGFLTQKNYFAPTQSLLQKWLREKYDINLAPIKSHLNKLGGIFCCEFNNPFTCVTGLYTEDNCKTYEEALGQGLKEALKLINKYK
tara:strand:+ start:551 stop:1027 length:477 start_codon:yes stop_codon:yes gene_type:complete